MTPAETTFGNHDDGGYDYEDEDENDFEVDEEDENDFDNEDDEDQPTSAPASDPYEEPDDDESDDDWPDEDPNSLSAQIAAMRAKMANRRSVLDDDDDLPPPPSTPSTPNPTLDNDDEGDGYFGSGVPNITAGRRRPADVVKTGWREKIPLAIKGIQNPGIRAMAEKLAKPKGGGNSTDMAKFVYFFTQLIANNLDAKKILAMPDLADRYKEIAKKVEHPEYMGKVGNFVNYGFLYPASENPAGFYQHINDVLQRRGIRDGVDMSPPKKRGG